MKKLYILFLLALLLVGCTPGGTDPIDPTDITPDDLQLIIEGNEEINIPLGDTFIDPGAYIENLPDVDFEDIEVDGNVDTTQVGTYTITYSYTYEGVTFTGTRTVHVVNNATVSCVLAGEATMRIPLFDPITGSTWEDPGLDCTGNTAIMDLAITDDVDDTTLGTYIVVYNYFNGTSFVELERTVIVELPHMDDDIVCTVQGPLYISLTVGDSFTVSNYECTGDPILADMQVTNDVNTELPGTYYVTYNYFDGQEFVDIIVTVDVQTPDEPISCELVEGDMTINVGDTWVDPGTNCTGDPTVVNLSVSGTVNTAIAGAYTIYYSYFDGTTMLEIQRIVTVIDNTTGDPVCTLINPNMVLNVGDVFTDPLYTCTGDTSTMNMTTTGSVDTSLEGTYTIEYTYTSGEQDVTLTRTVEVVSDNFILLGEEEVTIPIDTVWVDPGYSIDDGFTVTVDGTVDTSLVGTYTITYSYENSSGNTIALTRTITVTPLNYYTDLVIDMYNGGYNNSYINVYLTGQNVDYEYTTYQIQLLEDDNVVTTETIVEGENSFYFSNLKDYSTYKVIIVGTLSDTTTETEELYEKYMEPAYPTPTVSFTNETMEGTTFSIDFEAVGGSFNKLKATVLDSNGSLLETFYSQEYLTSGTFTFELEQFQEVTIKIYVYSYDGTQYLYSDVLYTTSQTSTTSSNFTVLGETANMYLNDSAYALIKLSDDVVINALWIDGVMVTESFSPTGEFTFGLDTSFEGTHNHTITKVRVMSKEPGSQSQDLDVNIPLTYIVLDSSTVVEVPSVLDFTNDLFPGTNFDITLYNPSNLTINSITVNNDTYSSFDSYSTNVIELSYDNDLLQKIEVKEITYTYGGMTFYSLVSDYNFEFDDNCAASRIELYTAQDVLDMISGAGGCYELMNDVDLGDTNRYDWYEANVPTMAYYQASNGFADSPGLSIRLNGNGYTISGFKIGKTDTNQSYDKAYGLFGYLRNSHIENLNLDVTVNIGNQATFRDPQLYVGGLAGRILDSYIENVHVTGYIGGIAVQSGAIGGLVGYVDNSVISESTTNATVAVSSTNDPEGLGISIGGVIGVAYASDIELVSAHNYLTLPTNNNGGLITAGGVAGMLISSDISDAYFDAGQTGSLSGDVGVAGGVIGQYLNGSTIGTATRLYSLEDISINGVTAGGLIGYVNFVTLSDSFVGDISVSSSTNAGLIIGAENTNIYDYDYLQGENIYILDTATLGYDPIHITIDTVTLIDLESDTFYSSLGFLEYYYDLEDADSYTHYYPKFD